MPRSILYAGSIALSILLAAIDYPSAIASKVSGYCRGPWSFVAQDGITLDEVNTGVIRSMSHDRLRRIHKRISEEYKIFEQGGFGVKPIYAYGPGHGLGERRGPTQRYLVALNVCDSGDWVRTVPPPKVDPKVDPTPPPKGRCFDLTRSDRYGPHNGRTRCCNENGGSRWWGSHYGSKYSAKGKPSNRSCEYWLGRSDRSSPPRSSPLAAPCPTSRCGGAFSASRPTCLAFNNGNGSCPAPYHSKDRYGCCRGW
ncbi:hypothetical protein ACFL17_08480 [Pseudomonadota bacterium]